MANDETKTKKQLNQDALTASIESRWEDAVAINDQLLERYPRDAEAYNRKGRAFMEMRKLTEAREAYQDALKADPANMIARRNLQRLELMHNRAEGSPEGSGSTTANMPKSAVFIEETGRTWIDELSHPAEAGTLAEVSPGDELTVSVEGEHAVVKSAAGTVLGSFDQSISRRISDAVDSGREFQVYALGMSGQSLRVIIREVSRPDDNSRVATFPRQDLRSQDLLREREQLSLREEGDFDFGDYDAAGDDDAESDEYADDSDPNDEEDSSPMSGDSYDDEPEEM